MSEWLDYLDKCWRDGYAAYDESRPWRRLVDVPGPHDGVAREAFAAGWHKAEREYQNTDPNKLEE